MRPAYGILVLFGLIASSATLAAQKPQPKPLPTVKVEAIAGEPFGSWPDSLRARLRDSLTSGRERWEKNRPRDYLVAVISTMGMFRVVRDPAYDGQLEASRVRGDSIVGVVRRPAPQFTPSPDWQPVTIDGVFRHLERAVAIPDRQIVKLKLDPVWGFPTEWKTDDASNGYSRRYQTEQVSGGAVVFFEPDTMQTCSWIRRAIRRCGSRT